MATRIEPRPSDQSLPFLKSSADGTSRRLEADTPPLFPWGSEEAEAETSAQLLLPRRPAQSQAFQRCVDLTLATLFLLVLWPVMLAIALIVVLTSPGPAFYSQKRLGLNGETFGCLKFRTMLVGADALLEELLESSPALRDMWMRDRKLRQDPRITPIGRFLRRYSLDELPQLLNVLRGEMSIVGPRPIATDEVHFYAESYALYCSVKPGITEPWQVGGRNDVSYQRRVQLDCEYARTKCLRQDLGLLIRTIPVVLGGTGM